MMPDERPRLQKPAAIIALGGVAAICGRLLRFNGPRAFWGGVAVVVGAASAAFANVLVKARSMQLAPAMLAACQMIFGIIPLLLLGLVVDGNPARFHWTATSVFFLLYLAVIGSALTFLLLYWLPPRLTVAQLQSISLITPPGAVTLGRLLGSETFPT
jgi:drug/metabolite transporter (DMT)-like permease